jgi:hypothetical protein
MLNDKQECLTQEKNDERLADYVFHHFFFRKRRKELFSSVLVIFYIAEIHWNKNCHIKKYVFKNILFLTLIHSNKRTCNCAFQLLHALMVFECFGSK